MAYIREQNGHWYACYRDPGGKQRSEPCGKGTRGKKAAEQFAAKIAHELRMGTFSEHQSKTWDEFVEEYLDDRSGALRNVSSVSAKAALDAFARLVQPRLMWGIDTKMLDDFVRMRRAERGKRKGSFVSPATINKELRSLRAALYRAHRWGYTRNKVEVSFVREDSHEPTWITPEQFAALYEKATAASRPGDLPNGVTTADFWRALLLLAYMTGWRIGQIMDLQWSDVDLATGNLFSPSDRNKGHRDVACSIHPLVVEELSILQKTFCRDVFPWDLDRRGLYCEFQAIQEAAGAKPPRGKEHFGFHDLRRGFATNNAKNLSLFELQRLMQHSALDTTRRYVAMAHRDDIVGKLAVPPLKPRQNGDSVAEKLG